MFCPKEVGSNMNERYFSLHMAEIPSRPFIAFWFGVGVGESLGDFSLLMRRSWEGCQAWSFPTRPTTSTFSAHANHLITQPA